MIGKKLFIGIPNSQGMVPAEFFWSFIGMQRVCQVSMARATSPCVNVRNNLLLHWFLESDCDYYIQMDIDETYPPDYLTKMVPLIDEYKVIGALTHDRWAKNNFMPIVFKEVEKESLQPLIPFNIKDKTGIHEVPYLHATVFMAREVVEKIPKPVFELHFNSDGLGKSEHTDFAFNDKIKKAGYPIYVNLDVTTEHLAEIPVSREFSEKWNESL